MALRYEDKDTAMHPLLNVSTKHDTSQCYHSRARSIERGAVVGGDHLWKRVLGLRNRYESEGVHRGVLFVLV